MVDINTLHLFNSYQAPPSLKKKVKIEINTYPVKNIHEISMIIFDYRPNSLIFDRKLFSSKIIRLKSIIFIIE